jgi:tetratricopeptide (TPR) repeat protein
MSPIPAAARDLLEQARIARQQSHLPDAQRFSKEAVSASREENDVEALISSLRMRGQVQRDLGRPEEALAPYQEAVELCRDLGLDLRFAHAVRHLGDVLLELHRPEEAAIEFESALEIYQRNSGASALDLANARRGYALAHENLGNARAATALWKQARSTYMELGIAAGASECDEHLQTAAPDDIA